MVANRINLILSYVILALISLWSVQHSTPRIACPIVLRTPLLLRWREIMYLIRCQSLERECIHDDLYLSGYWKMVLVISRLCPPHLLSNMRPLLLIFPTPYFPITPLHCSSPLPTRALKSPSITSLSVAGMSHITVSKQEVSFETSWSKSA